MRSISRIYSSFFTHSETFSEKGIGRYSKERPRERLVFSRQLLILMHSVSSDFLTSAKLVVIIGMTGT